MKKFLIASFIIIALLAAVFGFFAAVATRFALLEIFVSLTPTAPLFPRANIIVLGVDSAFGHRSDTIMILHTDPGKKSASVISIPRDTLALLPGRGLDKINHAYAYGGVELARKSVENLLNIEIPYYIVVDLTGIVNIIDELGGLTLDVEKRMYYVDYSQDLHIDLQPGVQKLNGRQVMGYLRFRHDDGDLARINRQQKFLKALGDELMRRENLVRSPKLFLTMLSYLDTNLNSRETLGLGLGLRAAQELGQISMTTIPGTDLMIDGIYYMKPDEVAVQKAVRQYLYGEMPTS